MAQSVERCQTGIEGLDELVGGGFPRGRCILLTGGCGTGKTTLAVQFLVNGAEKYNEPGVLLTLEQSASEIKNDMLAYGLDLTKLEESGKIIIIDTSLSKVGLKDFVVDVPITPKKSFSLLPGEFDLEKITKITCETAKKIGAKRVIIDSLPAIDVLMQDKFNLRKLLVNMNYELKNHGLTAIMISETVEDDGISKYEIEEYVTDGVIILKANEALDTRTIRIRKMRLTKHSLKPMTLEFTGKGLKVASAIKKGIV
ncbi:MAG: ATPase domain-containing protein [Candidatus Altiarchaeota archaeon]